MRHVDIYGTIGPMCSDVETLAAMFDAGMTGIRLNLSHVTLKESENLIANLHKAAEMSGVKAQLLIDLQGPELRSGRMNAPLDLREGDVLDFMEQGDPDARKSQVLRKSGCQKVTGSEKDRYGSQGSSACTYCRKGSSSR